MCQTGIMREPWVKGLGSAEIASSSLTGLLFASCATTLLLDPFSRSLEPPKWLGSVGIPFPLAQHAGYQGGWGKTCCQQSQLENECIFPWVMGCCSDTLCSSKPCGISFLIPHQYLRSWRLNPNFTRTCDTLTYNQRVFNAEFRQSSSVLANKGLNNYYNLNHYYSFFSS